MRAGAGRRNYQGMATLHLDDALYRRIQASAEARGSSADAEAARLIKQSMSAERSPAEQAKVDALINRLRASHERQRAHHGGELPDSTELIRKIRDERDAELVRHMTGKA